MNHERALNIISKAWGDQEGYCFFPYIDREAQRRTGSRRAGYHEGPGRDPKHPKGEAFKWPEDRREILEWMRKHEDHDLYWCPSLFEYPVRRTDVAMDEHALWADLDEADPREIHEHAPTIAWESSPGRYQALWLAAEGTDFMGASWPGNENQKLTYAIGADASGWDTTQLLRIPGWRNHKYPDKPEGKVLWTTGDRYLLKEFGSLPEIATGPAAQITDALEHEIENLDRHEVLARIRLKLPHRARELLNARDIDTDQDKSGTQWWLTRALADVGCSVAEIVAIIRALPWNKFKDRSNELHVLISEASKAIALRPDDDGADDKVIEEVERPDPLRLGAVLKNIRKPKFLVEEVLTEGATGFIAGEPKSFKSWVGLDLALSVATGADFLGHFRVNNPGPVLYVQEEDPPPVLKERSGKIWASKTSDQVVMDETGIWWLPSEVSADFDPDIMALIQKGLVVSDEAWQIYLDEKLAEGMNGEPYRLLLIDTLMMVAGEVEETRAQEMTTKIFKPTKVLARKHGCALIFIHHMGKNSERRAGQRLLGSVANHAWAEDSIYLLHAAGGDMKMELESKSAAAKTWRVGNVRGEGWQPEVGPWRKEEADRSPGAKRERSSRQEARPKRTRSVPAAVKALDEGGPTPMTTKALADAAGITYQQAHRQLHRALEAGTVLKTDNGWMMGES